MADAHQLAQVYFQAAVGEAALGEFEQTERRLDAVIALRGHDLLAMARTAAAFVDNLTLVTGNEWVTGKPLAKAMGQTESLDERVPPAARALTLRLMSAWSSQDRESVRRAVHRGGRRFRGRRPRAGSVRIRTGVDAAQGRLRSQPAVAGQRGVQGHEEPRPSLWEWERPEA